MKDKLLEIINEIAPEDLAESWDNCGMQINCGKEEINKVLISLEITHNVIDEAIENNVDFIITHHPLIFDDIKQVDINDITGNYVMRLINAGISVYSAHTSFDSAIGGNNDFLFMMLELTKFRRLNPVEGLGDDEDGGMCRMGEMKNPMTLKEVCILVEEKLGVVTPLKIVGNMDKVIKTVGLCTGAGGEFLMAAKRIGCDLFITGDLKHHHALWAKEAGIAVIDAGHYGTEWIFKPNMAKQLRKAVSNAGIELEIVESKINTDPFFNI